VILRLTAALALVLGLVVLFGFLQVVGKAPWSAPAARHLRAMKDRAVAPDRLAPYTTADFLALPHDRPLAEYARLEARGVSFDGFVQRLLGSADGDTHLELVATPRRPGGPDTAYVTAEITPQWRRDSDRWVYESLVAIMRPNHGGATTWDSGPLRVRVSGWLLYDFQYDRRYSPYALQHGARITGWEIHPVTRIEAWDDSLGRFADVPR
jgi:hypothetical protein